MYDGEIWWMLITQYFVTIKNGYILQSAALRKENPFRLMSFIYTTVYTYLLVRTLYVLKTLNHCHGF